MAEIISSPPPLMSPGLEEDKAVSPWKEAWRSFRKNKLAILGLAIVVFFILLAIFAKWLAPYGFNDQVLANKHLAPCGKDFCCRHISWNHCRILW